MPYQQLFFFLSVFFFALVFLSYVGLRRQQRIIYMNLPYRMRRFQQQRGGFQNQSSPMDQEQEIDQMMEQPPLQTEQIGDTSSTNKGEIDILSEDEVLPTTTEIHLGEPVQWFNNSDSPVIIEMTESPNGVSIPTLPRMGSIDIDGSLEYTFEKKGEYKYTIQGDGQSSEPVEGIIKVL